MTDCYDNGGFTRRAPGAFTANETDDLVRAVKDRSDVACGLEKPSHISVG